MRWFIRSIDTLDLAFLALDTRQFDQVSGGLCAQKTVLRPYSSCRLGVMCNSSNDSRIDSRQANPAAQIVNARNVDFLLQGGGKIGKHDAPTNRGTGIQTICTSVADDTLQLVEALQSHYSGP